MGVPNPRYGSKFGRRTRARPLRSRWTARRNFLANLPTAATPPTDSFNVGGTITPDVTGLYDRDGTAFGNPAYKHTALNYWLWTGNQINWVISNKKGGFDPGAAWVQFSGGPTGPYVPFQAPAAGTADVTAT